MSTKVLSFWGKGGVGKTTCSAAVAVALSIRGYKTLILTNDPTPSLSDIFEQKLNSNPTKISDLDLYALEISDDATIKMWKEKYGPEVYDVISSFLPVDESIIDYVASAPMIADEFILALLKSLKESNEYDVIVWDTAPAGGSLKLIKLEKMFYEHLGNAVKLYISVKSTFQRLLRRKKKNPLELIESWKNLAMEILEMVKKEDFHTYVVTTPEWLGFAETQRIIQELKEFEMIPYGLIINRIVEKGGCDCTFWKNLTEIHYQYLQKFIELFSDQLPIYKIPMHDYDIRGIDKLKSFSKNIEHLIIEEVSSL